MKMIAALLLALGIGGAAAAAATAPSAPNVRYWILHGPGEEAQAMATDPRGVKFLSDPSRIVLYPVNARVPAPSSWNVIPWKPYASFAKFQEDVNSGRIPRGTQVVGYDIESWRFSPSDEQADPIGYTIKFAQLAHAHGFKVISTPAEDLMGRLAPGENKFLAFEKFGMAKAVAPYVDFYHIQAQGLQHNIDGPAPSFLSFTRNIIAQVHDANPNTIITVGISTNTPGDRGHPTSGDDIVATVRAVDPLVRGYWLNIVGGHNETAMDAVEKLGTPQP